MTSRPNWTSTLETLAVQDVDAAAHALDARAVDAAPRVVKLRGRSAQGGLIRSVNPRPAPPRPQFEMVNVHFK